MEQELIGVIVPVYKVEQYVAECIESILAQTYTNFRLILVDDGTPDNAGKICDEYAKKDSRITVIHQENAGVTRARARGVKEAKDCEWITFVDSDDTITADALTTMYSYTKRDIDIVFATIGDRDIPARHNITNIEYRHWAVKNIYYIGAPWSKLIRRYLLDNHVFNIPSWIKLHEDTIMNIRIAFNAQKGIMFCEKVIYNYRHNDNGASQTFKKDIKYEGLLYEQIKDSIPQSEINTYVPDTIPYRLLIWRRYYMYRYCVNDMATEKFYKDLQFDIQNSGYKLTFIESKLFYCTNPLLRFILINTKKIGTIIERFTRRKQ